MKRRVPTPTCGKILAHAVRQVHGFRERMGLQVCVFKIGVTAAPEQRFEQYLAVNFSCMWIVHESHDLGLIHMLEAALVAQFHQCTGCRNMEGTGGEGGLNRKNHLGPPFFVHVTGGRADQFKRVG